MKQINKKMKSRLSDEERGAEEADDAELAEHDDSEIVCGTQSAVPCRRRKPECGENVYFPILLPTELCPEGSTITFKELPRPSDGKPALFAVVDDPHNEDEQITLELCEMTPNGEEHSSWLLDDLVTSRIFLIFLFSLIFLFFLILIFSFVFIFSFSLSLSICHFTYPITPPSRPSPTEGGLRVGVPHTHTGVVM